MAHMSAAKRGFIVGVSNLPNLAGVATAELVEQVGGGNFKASYINWSRTMHLLRTHAPGWLPELLPSVDGGIIHRAPVGAYLMICFVHSDGSVTPAVPQAIMDNRNNAIALDAITARDVTDTHRRGVCMAAALTFGLAYELWAKIQLESGYAPPQESEEAQESPHIAAIRAASTHAELNDVAEKMKADFNGKPPPQLVKAWRKARDAMS